MRMYLATVSLVILSGLVAASDRVPAAGGDIEITPIIHASVQVEYAGTVIQIDPWSAGDLAKVKPADLILITDDPVHHLDLKAIPRRPRGRSDEPGHHQGEVVVRCRSPVNASTWVADRIDDRDRGAIGDCAHQILEALTPYCSAVGVRASITPSV